MDSNKCYDIFCINCDGYRKQKLKGRNSYDGTLLYICTECGCENSHSQFRSCEHWTEEQREKLMEHLLKDKN